MHGKGITDDGLFIKLALHTIGEFMEADGLSSIFHKSIAPSSAPVCFAKALSRSVTGSMNDHIQGAKFMLEDGLDPHDLGFRLNKTPLSALTRADGSRYANPNEVLQLLTNHANE